MLYKSIFRFAAIVASAFATTSCTVTTHDDRFDIARLEVDSQRIALAVKDISLGDARAFNRLESISEKLKGIPKEVMPEFDKERRNLIDKTTRLLGFRKLLDEAAKKADELDSTLSVLISRVDELRKVVSEKEGSRSQVIVAYRLELSAVRMRQSMHEILRGSAETQQFIDRLQRDSKLYTMMLQGLLRGSEELEVMEVTSGRAKEILDDIQERWSNSASLLDDLISSTSPLGDLDHALSDVEAASDSLVALCEIRMGLYLLAG
jgi:hypothetical protein